MMTSLFGRPTARRTVAVALMVCALGTGYALGQSRGNQPTGVYRGFYTARQFLDMYSAHPAQAREYAAGLIDGMLLAPLFGAPIENMQRLENCRPGVSADKASAMLAERFKDDPAMWQRSAHGFMFLVLLSRCPDVPAAVK